MIHPLGVHEIDIGTGTLQKSVVDYMNPAEDLEAIFKAGVRRVDPYQLIKDAVEIQNDRLLIELNESRESIDLSNFDQIFVIGFGKATAKMAKAIEEILGKRLTAGIISVKLGHAEPLGIIRSIEAGHPVPDENGLKAAKTIVDLASRADKKTLVLTLISGGGSALIPYPWAGSVGACEVALSLTEKQEITRLLLQCGATITEINTVRKHLSRIKGGRLAELLFPAVSLNLILSDVVGDHLDVIASGATSPDITTFADMQVVFEKYGLTTQIPDNALKILQGGLKTQIPETPKPGDKIFENVSNLLIGTNHLALMAAKQKAEQLGYQSRILNSQLVGEAREVGKALYKIARDSQKKKLSQEKPFCLLFGGETTVTIKGDGKGGRNQEMALSFLSEIADNPSAAENIAFLSAGTDGNDGPTDAAGAFATVELLGRARKKEISIVEYLNNNDAYHFFNTINGLLKTGPTNTNVCDIQIILIC